MVIRNARFVPHHRSVSAAALLTAAALALTGCTIKTAEGDDGKTGEKFQVREPSGPALVLDSSDPAELALTSSQAFFHTAPVAVVATADNADARSTAAATGAAITAPVLLSDGGVSDTNLVAELERLGAEAVVVVGGDRAAAHVGAATGEADVVRFDPDALSAAAEAAASAGSTSGGGAKKEQKRDDAVALPTAERLSESDVADLRRQIPDVTEPNLLQEVLVAVDPKKGQEAAMGTALAAGAVPVEVPGGDPAAHPETAESIRVLQPLGVVGIGAEFGSAENLGWRVAVASSGAMLPNGALRQFPGRYVATSYTVSDALEPAAEAQGATGSAAMNAAVLGGDPAIRLTASVRSSEAGTDGDYVAEQPTEVIAPAVAEILNAGQLVLLDVAPGNQRLVEQIGALEPTLSQPGVGLSVHPEFRATGNGADAGSVPVSELQAVVDRLADIATANGLPQILLEVHQSRAASVVDRQRLNVPPQVAVVFTAAGPEDGEATADGVWADVATDLPPNTHLGWSAPADVPADPMSILPAEPLLGLVSAG